MLLSCFHVAVASLRSTSGWCGVDLRSAVSTQGSSERNTRQLNLSLTKRYWSLQMGEKEKLSQAQFPKYLGLLVKPWLQKPGSGNR